MQYVFGAGVESLATPAFLVFPHLPNIYPSTQTFLLTGSNDCWSASLSVPFPPRRATPTSPCPLAGWHGWGAGTRVEAPRSSLAVKTSGLSWLHLDNQGLTVPPNLRGYSLLTDLNLSYNQLTVSPDLTGCPLLKNLTLENNQLTVGPDLTGCSQLWILNLSGNQIKTFPDIAHLHALTSLYLENNALHGPLPDIKFLATLTLLWLKNNPLLHGALPKSLVAQCTRGLTFSGCRQWSDCTPEQQKQGLYLRTPFFVGVTVASLDIEAYILQRIKSLGITLAMMLDAPAKGDPTSAMVKQKGKDWIPWQEQWLNGLLALKSGSKIFAILTEKNFKAKYDNESQCDSPAKCAALNFDPEWGLATGERATSILDWEARQFARVSELHGLKVCKFVHGYMRDDESDADTSWYPVPHDVQRRV